METQISLKNLTLSPLNVRKVKTSAEEDAQLRALIESQGVLQNLIVIPSPDAEGRYEVIAGGRRLSALNHLLAEGKIDAEFPVRCVVKTESEAIEASLAENYRSDMHPADRFVAYKAMLDAGRSIEDIAKRFGKTVTEVKKLLKLGAVSPVILDAFRSQEMNFDMVMAFTVTDDQKAQESVFAEVKDQYHPSPRFVRQKLLNTDVTTDDTTFKFVGQEAYEAAGGTLSEDLFADSQYVNDVDLLNRLADEKLDKLQESFKAEGWGFVEATLDGGYSHPLRFAPCIDGETITAPDSVIQEFEAKERELEGLMEAAPDHEDEEANERFRQLNEELNDLKATIDASREFSDEQKQSTGVLLSVDFRTGELVTKVGIALPKKQPEKAQNEDGTTTEAPKPTESHALKSDLEAYRLQALEAAMMQKAEICLDMTIFTMAKAVLAGSTWYQRPLGIDLDVNTFSATKDIEETSAAAEIRKHRDALDLSWLAQEGDLEQFKAFQKLSRASKLNILAHCSAQTLRCATNEVEQYVAEQIKFDLSKHWQPTKANYFNRIKKGKLIEILKDLKGDEFALSQADAKKGDLATILDELDETTGWLPESLTKAA
ncbi:ParB/RepB/Spo0J family partition protein [Marinobacter adhaerens]|uniref:ParB/RepB/Spo0J family partition protein n=1 Tax=Marinobacter adhaerens TaxID=1033846 RepID=UPI001E2F5858|nr:ParB/RepB/Spo0J family partition protein [Marinobacter adhaerens]MCD1649635.1 ParB N-terminal domain-containing protein [Marinobacter adhaerens]